MKIIIVGGTGTLGKAVAQELKKRHEIIVAGYRHGDVNVDIKDLNSIKHMYQSVGQFDALISTTGKVHFGGLVDMTSDDYLIGIHDKLMGQVNLVLTGLHYINANGSFTLTSGILSDNPIRSGSSASMINGAIESFVISAAIEMPQGIRINVVSPTILTESVQEYGNYFLGFEPIPAARAALAFSRSVEGAQTGQIYTVGKNL
jgi:NAD(P)-dependent dehydrogenase (short-subunit alcohol dehydrogenase family)